MRSFDELNLIEPILTALKDEGYTTPTPIQLEAIPHLLAGSDLLGYAQTGTGKTAAFALPILQHLTNNKKPTTSRVVRALVLAPTRELAAQINDSFHTYGKNLKLSYAAIFGGVGHGRQIQQLSRGVDVLIATPGRLLDLVNQGYVRLNALEFFVLDEADQMFDMGFIHDLKKIVRLLPHNRQTLLFSATMPADISELASKILNKPVTVEVTPVASTAEKIEQKVIFIEQGNKNALLGELLKDPAITRALVFSRTKHGANRIYEKLESLKIRCEAIHGNKSQNARQKALEDFRSGHVRVLVGTDIAARGIDVDGISHVINFDLPNVPESYIHRIGRTARAGTEGVAISFCSKSERSFLRDIERLIKKRLPSEESSVVASESDKPKKSQHADQMKRSFSQKPSSGRNDNGSARSDRGPRAEGGSAGNGFDRPKRSFDRPSGGSSEGRSFAPRSASGGRSDNGPSRFDRAPRAEGASSGNNYDRPKRSFDRPSGGSSEGRPYAPRPAFGGRSDNGPSRFDRAPRAEGASSGNNYDRPKRSFDRPSGGSSEGRPYAPRSASGGRSDNGPARFDRAPRAEGGSAGNNYDRPNRSFDRPSGGSSEGRPYAPRSASGGRSDNGPSRFDRAPRAEGGSAGNNYDRPKRSFDRPSGGSSEGRPYAPRSASGGRSDNGPSRFDRAPRAEGGAAGNNSDRPKKPYQKSTKPANRPFSPRPSNGGGSKFSKGNDNSGGAFKDKKAV